MNETKRHRGAVWILIVCIVIALGTACTAIVTMFALGVTIDTRSDGSHVLRVDLLSTPAPSPFEKASPSARPLEPAVIGDTLPATQIFRKVAPCVVGIVSNTAYNGEQVPTSSGSGIIVRENGYILTNYHVVADSTSLTVILDNGTEYEAEYIGGDFMTDIAILKIKAKNLTTWDLGSSASIQTGEKCYAIGNPLGMELQNTITDGLVSAVSRDIVLDDAFGEISMTVIQTNCQVNSGNSGGPLINEQGQVIGIVSSKIMGDYNESVEGLGFAIPVDTAVDIINSLVEFGYVKGRPSIGVTAAQVQLDPETADALELPMGILLAEVDPMSDAYVKGIKPSDIITHVQDERVYTIADVTRVKNLYKAGDLIDITVFRKGVGEMVFNVELMEIKPQ